MKKVIVEIPRAADHRWKSWRKLLTGVDREKANGYAFQGEFLPRDRKVEVEIGSYILIYDEVGSTKYHQPEVSVRRVEADGNLTVVLSASGKSWALDLRDAAAALFAADPAVRRTELEAEAALLRARLAEIEEELKSLE